MENLAIIEIRQIFNGRFNAVVKRFLSEVENGVHYCYTVQQIVLGDGSFK